MTNVLADLTLESEAATAAALRLARAFEADPSDDFSREDYYGRKHLGPAHLINITINATTGTGDRASLSTLRRTVAAGYGRCVCVLWNKDR